MVEHTRDEWIQIIKGQMNESVSYADNRSDIAIQQTSTDSEIQDVIAHVRVNNGDIRWIEEGVIMAYTNNKQSLFAICDYLDENDNVYEYELSLMEVQLNGVNVDVTDEIDLDDVRDMHNFFFKIEITMNPDVVVFDPVYVDIDQTLDSNPYTDDYDVYDYVMESPVYAQWKGSMNETLILTEKKGAKQIVLVPPKATNADAYFDINKYNVDSAEDNGEKKMFQDMGFTMTNISKNKEIDYEMNAKAHDVYVFDIESSDKEGDKILLSEMLNTIMESGREVEVFAESEILQEVKRKVKVNFKGKKRLKMQCAKGFKYDHNRRVCVKITGHDMMQMKRAHKKASRTKKASGTGFKLRTFRKTKKANRFRKLMGIKPNQMM